MPTIETSIDINVPVEPAYDQWREFEKFPQFMEGVKQVKHFDTNLEWKAEIAGQEKSGRQKSPIRLRTTTSLCPVNLASSLVGP